VAAYVVVDVERTDLERAAAGNWRMVVVVGA
jgi:hypothetical protein